jgi:hypothetical protein
VAAGSPEKLRDKTKAKPPLRSNRGGGSEKLSHKTLGAGPWRVYIVNQRFCSK